MKFPGERRDRGGYLADVRLDVGRGGSAISSVTTQSAKYDYYVFETATGRLLTSFTVKGEYRDCAETTVVHGPPTHETMPAHPDLAELKRLLEPLVTRQVG
jgi:hypothetical protein